jgi:hypothetical protein
MLYLGLKAGGVPHKRTLSYFFFIIAFASLCGCIRGTGEGIKLLQAPTALRGEPAPMPATHI